VSQGASVVHLRVVGSECVVPVHIGENESSALVREINKQRQVGEPGGAGRGCGSAPHWQPWYAVVRASALVSGCSPAATPPHRTTGAVPCSSHHTTSRAIRSHHTTGRAPHPPRHTDTPHTCLTHTHTHTHTRTHADAAADARPDEKHAAGHRLPSDQGVRGNAVITLARAPSLSTL
jgi:hypothetical protein